jgi:predicted lysophospholipase L1 biosynthesis ABC-type transport system permease subunit
VLFALILIVCMLFVANSASTSVRGRRRELGVLACLGWTRPRLFTAVLSELAAIGLAAGLLRTPGRALVGAVSLAVGITALTILAAVTIAFRGVVVGSLLGNAVAVQVRGVDYIAVTATVALGVLAAHLLAEE